MSNPATTPAIDPDILRRAQAAERVDIAVVMLPDRSPKPFALPRRVYTEEGRAWVRSVMAGLRAEGASAVDDLGDGILLTRLPSARVAHALHSLEQHPRVERVALAGELSSFMVEALDAAGLQYNPGGNFVEPFTGAANEEIVVIDVAFDVGHPSLAGLPNLVEYCACGRSELGSTPCCPNQQAFQQGAGLGLVPAPSNNRPASHHGTSVAAVIVGQSGLNLPLGPSSATLPPTLPRFTTQGAARHVTLHLINVQDRTTSPPGWIPTPTSNAPAHSFAGVIEALTQVRQWAQTPGRRIRAVNMSFGNLGVACAQDPLRQSYVELVAQLRQLGVVVVAASGNFATVPGSNPAVLQPTVTPGCVPGVLTVAASEHPAPGRGSSNVACQDGATTQANQLTCYSTVDDFVDLVAPSNMRIPVSSSVDGSYARQVANTVGTSFAAPVVAACAAQMAGALQSAGAASNWSAANAEAGLTGGPQRASRCHPLDADCLELQQRPLLNCSQAYAQVRAGSAALPLNQVGLSGTYFDVSLQGQGFLFDLIRNLNQPQGQHLLFGAWFTYALPGTAGGAGLRWYTLTGWFNGDPTEVAVKIHRSGFGTAPAFGLPLQGLTQTEVADATVRFRTCRDVEIEYHNAPEFNVPTIAEPLLRPRIKLTRADSPRCVDPGTEFERATGSRCAAVFPDQVTGTWQRAGADWTADTQHLGRGFLIEGNSGQQCAGGYLFGAWYDYAGAADNSAPFERHRWFTFSSCGDASRIPNTHSYRLFLTLTHGGERLLPFPDPAWSSQPPTYPQCPGSYGALLTFHDCNRATLSYDFGMAAPAGYAGIQGQTGSINLVRSVAVAGCQLP